MEHFYTLQGEGKHAGKAAYFIRLAGCDVGCHWCDVKDSWDTTPFPAYSAIQLLQFVLLSKANMVVITGGEPAMYDLTQLTTTLKSNNLTVNIETSGAYPIKGTFDWICVSPKKFKEPLIQSLQIANELKVIVFNKHDLNWAQTFENQIQNNCIKLLQPEWDQSNKINPHIVDFIKNNPSWQLSLQTHKYLNIP